MTSSYFHKIGSSLCCMNQLPKYVPTDEQVLLIKELNRQSDNYISNEYDISADMMWNYTLN